MILGKIKETRLNLSQGSITLWWKVENQKKQKNNSNGTIDN